MTLAKSEMGFQVSNPPPSIDVLGTPVACATYDSALQRIKALARQGRPTAICPANTHIVAEARHDPAFRKTVARFDLVAQKLVHLQAM